MTFQEYQKLAQRTSDTNHDKVLNGMMGLTGECGELVDLVKKYTFQSGDDAELPRVRLILECGDILWYVVELYSGLGWCMEEITKPNNALARITPTSIQKLSLKIAGTIPTIIFSAQKYENAVKACSPDNPVITARKKILMADISTLIGLVNMFAVKYLNTDLETVMTRNIEKLKKRYPDGFDPERSLHREGETPC